MLFFYVSNVCVGKTGYIPRVGADNSGLRSKIQDESNFVRFVMDKFCGAIYAVRHAFLNIKSDLVP